MAASWVRARASEGGGVQVERPQPEARTNDLDAGAGWRMLDVVDDRVLVVGSRQGREVRTRFPRLVREGRLGCRDISSPTGSGARSPVVPGDGFERGPTHEP
jgi:hypothetical protein